QAQHRVHDRAGVHQHVEVAGVERGGGPTTLPGLLEQRVIRRRQTKVAARGVGPPFEDGDRFGEERDRPRTEVVEEPTAYSRVGYHVTKLLVPPLGKPAAPDEVLF